MSQNLSFANIWLLVFILFLLIFFYLLRINQLLKSTPREVVQLAGRPWNPEELKKLYTQLENDPIDTCKDLPPKLDRRYVVTGGNGLVGGYIVLQLLARGTPIHSIRIIDIRKPERTDMHTGPPAEVDFIPTDIRSMAAVSSAFNKPWNSSVADLPLTVFHTAAVILASDRSKYLKAFPWAINVQGTENVLAAARAAGATVFSSTSSASIGIRTVNPWVVPWASQPSNYWQFLDTKDFDKPLKASDEFYGTYPASKAAAERVVCAANSKDFRTGCIRPANGVYGNPTDNMVGGVLSKSVFPTWTSHIVQNIVHGANVAMAHLQQEAVLLSKSDVKSIPQAGRPFVVTDPNPPIFYNDTYIAIATLTVHPFRIMLLQPVVMLLLSYLIEWYNLLPLRYPIFNKIVDGVKGDARALQPGIFSICTHLIASDEEARKPVKDGGLGYKGIITSKEGLVMEILEWNREHQADTNDRGEGKIKEVQKKIYTTSANLADQLRQSVNV